MFNSNWSCVFTKKKSNRILPIKTIKVWENKKVIQEVKFDNLKMKSPKYKENIVNVYNVP